MPTVEALGNGITQTAKYDDSLGLAQMISATFGLPPTSPPGSCANVGGSVVQCLEYTYDQFSNLAQQKKYYYPIVAGTLSTLQATATEVYQYDDLQRLLGESRSYTNLTPTSNLSESYSYDDTGNILSKSDFGGPYVYGTATRPSANNAGPHAVVSVGAPAGWSYKYDMNGNMLSDGQRNVTYDDEDRPEQITMNGVTTIFRYTPDGDRYLQRTTSSSDTSINRTIYYLDKDYERVDWDQKPTEERTYCGKGVVIEQKDGSEREVRYLHLDRLGSTTAVSDAYGGEIAGDAHGFDAFGRRRGRDWQPTADQMHPNGEWGTATNHGFTGHEQLDETYLTHMNGRVYDYRLGRFLSVDPIISDPAKTQAINPYSYLINNPFNGVDPTGYSCGDSDMARCDMIIFNPPQRESPSKTPTMVNVQLRDNGNIVFEGRVPINTALNALVPGFVGAQAPSNPGDSEARQESPTATAQQSTSDEGGRGRQTEAAHGSGMTGLDGLGEERTPAIHGEYRDVFTDVRADLDSTTERRLSTLHPEVAALARDHIGLMRREGLDARLADTLRTTEKQDADYAQGRTVPGKIITNAQGGHSYHDFGVAYDIAIYKDGHYVRDGKDPLYSRAGKLGQSLGLEWGGLLSLSSTHLTFK
jgi:RHS repeat-associated protein